VFCLEKLVYFLMKKWENIEIVKRCKNVGDKKIWICQDFCCEVILFLINL
jgi:hypothetical protein